MTTLAPVLVGLVALLHVYFLVLEMFLWATPFGARQLRRPLAELEASKVLAANQGLYNGFLAAGLVWGQLSAELLRTPVTLFFLSCVVVAGLYGGVTAAKNIFVVQMLPGLLALGAVWMTRS